MESKADKALDWLGFKLVKEDYKCGIWIYEHEEEDHRVELNFDSVQWTIHSTTISETLDFEHGFHREEVGLTYDEYHKFLLKIQELDDSRNLQSLL